MEKVELVDAAVEPAVKVAKAARCLATAAARQVLQTCGFIPFQSNPATFLRVPFPKLAVLHSLDHFNHKTGWQTPRAVAGLAGQEAVVQQLLNVSLHLILTVLQGLHASEGRMHVLLGPVVGGVGGDGTRHSLDVKLYVLFNSLWQLPETTFFESNLCLWVHVSNPRHSGIRGKLQRVDGKCCCDSGRRMDGEVLPHAPHHLLRTSKQIAAEWEADQEQRGDYEPNAAHPPRSVRNVSASRTQHHHCVKIMCAAQLMFFRDVLVFIAGIPRIELLSEGGEVRGSVCVTGQE
mmetsp:Transcript_37817/g.87548  ORF Transcript_37817/g.87548 Transcript_37817/m.87548 type:complete len:291 (+) Transcript_37817:565-1437(+)